MKKVKKIYIVTAISLSAFSLLFCMILLNFTKTSYAIETGTFNNGYPTKAFSTNIERGSESTTNYVQDIFGTDNSYANFIKNFNVNIDYSDNNNTNPLYVLMKNLEIPKATETFELTNGSITDISKDKNDKDKGITYIINHGFNNTNTVNTVFDKNLDSSKRYYITQVALWLYIYDNKASFSSSYCKNTGAGYSACDFIDNTNKTVELNTVITMLNKAKDLDDSNLIESILKLYNDAKDYKGGSDSSIGSFNNSVKYSFTNDNSMIYIYNLVPSITGNSDNYMYYAVEINDPNSYGVYVADKNDNKIDNTSQMNESFSVVIPIKEDISKIDLSSITIKVYAYFLLDENKSYRVTKSSSEALPNTTSNLVVKYNNVKYDRFADVVLGYSPYEIISTQFKLSNFTTISKVDATNSKELPGAKLVVTSKSNPSNKWEWVSTDKPHQIVLEDGDYTLCETMAPDGYELNTECVEFSVESGKSSAVKMENKPVHIPNTSSMVNKIIIFLGLAFIIAGGGIISYFSFYKKKSTTKKEA